MTQQFQLVCNHCRHTLVVEPRHAGNNIECENCKTLVEVPKLRDFKQLEPIPSLVTPLPKRNWDRLSGGFFVLGVLLLAVAVGSSIYLQVLRQRYRPFTEKPTIETKDFSLANETLSDTWRFWNSLLEVTDVSLRNEPVFIQAREAVKRLDFWSKVFYGVATVGILSIICAVFSRPKAVF